MNNLSFKTNTKKYAINGDENSVISINTTDFAMLDRIKKAQSNVKKLTEGYQKSLANENSDAIELFMTVDADIRAEINKIFGSDVCFIAFGSVNCASLCDDGSMLFENFMNAVIPVIISDIENAQKSQRNHIEKYTSQVKR